MIAKLFENYTHIILVSFSPLLQWYLIGTLIKSGFILFQFHSWRGAHLILLSVKIIEDTTFCLGTLIWKEDGGMGLRSCCRSEEKLMQNYSFLSRSHDSPVFPEKKVYKNTFQAFTGKLDKPIESKFRGGNGSLEGWMVLTSLNHELSARYGYAVSLQIINGRERSLEMLKNLQRKTRSYWEKHKRSPWLCFVRRDNEKRWWLDR